MYFARAHKPPVGFYMAKSTYWQWGLIDGGRGAYQQFVVLGGSYLERAIREFTVLPFCNETRMNVFYRKVSGPVLKLS